MIQSMSYTSTPKDNIYVCGGGRKNKFLIEKIENKMVKEVNTGTQNSV